MKINKKNRKTNLLFSAILMLFYIAFALIQYFFFYDSLVPFGLFTATATLAAFMLLLSWIDNIYYFGVVGFAFFAQFGGSMLKLYEIIPIYDIILHSLSGILLVFAAHYIFTVILKLQKSPYSIPSIIGLLFSFLTALASAAVWEIFEFTTDQLFGLYSQRGSLTDTMGDIIAGSCGAIAGLILLFFFVKKTVGKAYIGDRKD